ncbi:TatD family hydrolase, partial [Neisseria sicca]|uniref:TatD family hydrolase n=1 Tax=Neisseria sicca TaxID=490 RepID=UPI0021BF2A59
MLKERQTNSPLIHSFTEHTAFPKPPFHLPLYISFSPILTFKNPPQIQQPPKYLPPHRILLQTHSP